MANSNSWDKIFKDNKILKHDFSKSPYYLSADKIKRSVQGFRKTNEKEVRILCKIDSREDLPDIMRENGLILLPVKNGEYVLVQAKGFVDIPEITDEVESYHTKLNFDLDTAKIGNSEMQHLDFAYASSLIRTFMGDPSLVLTIRGRKFTPKFNFRINKQEILVQSVQTEVDAGYEGEKQIVLVEAKNAKTTNTIIRQLYYPFRQWAAHTKKDIHLLFFEKRKDEYMIWEYEFADMNDYNSIRLLKSKKYKIV